ncbi:MAG: 3',5'-cyclic-nucleotide phosphodiesterase [Polyangiaceae bacterium]
MELRIAGCNGGETPKEGLPAFIIDGVVAVDAGALGRALAVKEQAKLTHVLVTHAHLDHVRDIAMILDTRAQLGAPPLVVCGTAATLRVLKSDLFSGRLWPDFAKIPSRAKPSLEYLVIPENKAVMIGKYAVRAVPVNHCEGAVGYAITRGKAGFACTGDTGPTEAFWKVVDADPAIKLVLAEVSFPNEQARFAKVSQHYTPELLAKDAQKAKRMRDVPLGLYHIKPGFRSRTERDCARAFKTETFLVKDGDLFRL